MAIADYASLVEAVQKWCARSDNTFSNRIPDFVAMAEDRIYDGADTDDEGSPLYSPPLRNTTVETRGTVTFADGAAPLPDGFLGFRKIHREGDRIGLVYLPPERFSVHEAGAAGGMPAYYTIEGGEILTVPGFEGEMNATWWRRFPALTSEAPTNDVLTAHPTVYLTAVLYEAMSFQQEAELAIAHVARLRSMIRGLNGTANRARISGGTLRVQPRRPIP